MHKILERLEKELQRFGILLTVDPSLPSVCSIIVGEPIRGSWWSHPRSRDIYEALQALASRPSVLVAKLVSRKNTFIHRNLWPWFLAVATARELWQLSGLDREANSLFMQVEQQGTVTTKGPAAKKLEEKLLVHGEQFHSSSGYHAKLLMSWQRWAETHDCELPRNIAATTAKEFIESRLSDLNHRFHGRGRLPWMHFFERY
jgi:hypothetical protein